MSTKIIRSRYDTSVILLYHQRKEHLLPEEFRKSIPCSTVSTWRKNDTFAFKGHEFNNISQQAFEWYDLFSKHQKLKKVVRILCKVWIMLANIIIPVLKAKQHAELVLNEIQRLFTIWPKKLVYKITGWSIATFNYKIQKIKCALSPLNLCFKKHPKQLSFRDITIIKELFRKPEFVCWPVSSIAWYAKRENIISISLSTWYKYVSILGLTRKFIRPIVKTKGIVSFKPNQFLHVDTTFHYIPDGTKVAITFVSDNFSRHILGWSCSMKHGAQNVLNALEMACRTILKYYPQKISSILVCDGGSENNACRVTEWISKNENPTITKVVAMKDIAFSNSPLEAINKIMKRYIRHYNPQSFECIQKCVHIATEDYSIKRPHGSLNGFTPLEIYTQQIPTSYFSNQIKSEQLKRIETNLKNTCLNC